MVPGCKWSSCSAYHRTNLRTERDVHDRGDLIIGQHCLDVWRIRRTLPNAFTVRQWLTVENLVTSVVAFRSMAMNLIMMCARIGGVVGSNVLAATIYWHCTEMLVIYAGLLVVVAVIVWTVCGRCEQTQNS